MVSVFESQYSRTAIDRIDIGREFSAESLTVMEVVSKGAEAHKRDYEEERADYAKAGVCEYWIVDPERSLVTVLTLEKSEYRLASESRAGEIARSILLDGLAICVDDILALRKRP